MIPNGGSESGGRDTTDTSLSLGDLSERGGNEERGRVVLRGESERVSAVCAKEREREWGFAELCCVPFPASLPQSLPRNVCPGQTQTEEM